MRSRIGRVAPTVGLCLALWGACAASAFAQAGDKAFKDAMEAYDEKKWEQVIKLMQAAINAEPQESPRPIEYGGNIFGRGKKRTLYLPHYYLGEARYRLATRDCSGAIDAWGHSEAAGIIKNRPDLERIMRDGYLVCNKEHGVIAASEFDPLWRQAQQTYNDVNAIAAGVSKFGGENPDLFKDARAGYEAARGDLEIARQRLTVGARSRASVDLVEARRAIERARVALTTLDSSLRAAYDARTKMDTAAREAQQALQAATQLRDQLDAEHAAGGGIALSPAMNAARQQANRALERGNEQFAAGTKGNQQAYVDAKTLGQESASQFRALRGELDSLLSSVRERLLVDARTAAGQAVTFVDETLGTLDRRMTANPTLAADVAPRHAELVKRSTADRARLDAALRSDDAAAIARATRRMLEVRDLLTELSGRFGPLTLRERGVSEALEEGAARFFAGKYQDALTRLNPADGFAEDDPLELHVHLFRAAALYALYAQSGGTKPELRAQALAEIDACKKIDSSFQPDPRAFSPRFLAFYRDGRDAAAATMSQR